MEHRLALTWTVLKVHTCVHIRLSLNKLSLLLIIHLADSDTVKVWSNYIVTTIIGIMSYNTTATYVVP